MLSPVFSGLSRDQLAHVRRCQSIAQVEGLSVVSSGVLASPAAGAPAGAHFWLVGSPSSGAVSFVWLSASGRRLLCGCPRRRGGAFSCAHAQCVRLWLLSAAGVAVPVLGAGASAPDPEQRISQLCACGDHEDCIGVGWSGTIHNEWPCQCACHQSGNPDPDHDTSASSHSFQVGADAPTTTPADLPVCPCPGCGKLAPVGVVVPFGVCASCLDLEAEAAQVSPPARCPHHPGFLIVGESASGLVCPLCEQLAGWQREQSTHFTFEYASQQSPALCVECGAPADFLTHFGPLCGPCAAKHLAQFSDATEARMHEMVAEAERAEEEAAATNDPNRQIFLPDRRSKPEEA